MLGSARSFRFVFATFALVCVSNAVLAAEENADTKAVRDFAESITKNAIDGDRLALLKQIDSVALTEECLKHAGLELGFLRRATMGVQLSSKLGEELSSTMQDVAVVDVRNVEIEPDGQRATALIRASMDDGTRVYIRYWLLKKDGQWKCFDLEDLDFAMRTSVAFASVVNELSAPGIQMSLRDVYWLQKARTAMIEGDNTAAQAALDAVKDKSFPPTVEAMRWLFIAALRVAEEDGDAALEAIERVEALRDDVPIIHYLRAAAHTFREEYDLAITSANKYMEYVGPDPAAYLIIGTSLAALDRTPEALDAHRKALDDQPNSLDNLTSLAALLPEDNKEELVQRFLAIPKHAEQFESVASTLLSNDDLKSLEALALAWRERAPNDPNGIYYLASAYQAGDDLQSAVKVLPQSFPLVENHEERDYYYDLYIECMIGLDKAVEAYQQLPDKHYAIENLSLQLISYDKFDAIRQIALLHRRKFPDDATSYYYEGDVHYYNDELEQADRLYEEASKRQADEELSEMIRYSRILCWQKLGKGLEAYEQFAPKDETFRDLAPLFKDDKQVAELAQLVQRHEANTGDNNDVRYWKIHLHFLEQNYTAALELLEQHGQELIESGQTELDEIWIRSLVRLKKFDEALARAEKRISGSDEFNELLVYAAQGNLDKTDELVVKLLEEGYGPEAFLADDDLGPIFKSEPFTEIRERHLKVDDM